MLYLEKSADKGNDGAHLAAVKILKKLESWIKVR